jgi:hypothetical protein
MELHLGDSSFVDVSLYGAQMIPVRDITKLKDHNLDIDCTASV